MDVKELRVGNYYKSVKFGVPVKCHLTDFYELCHASDGATDNPPIKEMFEPIPLTEEWLVKFGITDQNAIQTKGGEIFTELKIKEVGICGEDSCTHGMIYYAKCEYVHQLQNLYWCLTGEELEIKNP